MTTSLTILCVKPCLGNQVCTTMLKRLQEATYQSMWVAVGNKLPFQREQANSEDPSAVVVMKGELIVGRYNQRNCAVCSVLVRIIGVSTVSGYEGSTAMRLAFSTCQPKVLEEEIFHGKEFS